MTAVFIAMAVLGTVQFGMCLVIYALTRKLKNAIYITRVGDRVFLEDGEGNIISEKIIIEKTI